MNELRFPSRPFTLRTLVRISSWMDLCKYRLVCVEWNRAVLKDTTFPKIKVTFGIYWVHEVIALSNRGAVPHWERIKLNRTQMPNIYSGVFLPQWSTMCVNLREFELYRAEIQCSTLCKILNNSPVLEEVYFNNVRFNYKDTKRTERHISRSYCAHTPEEELYTLMGIPDAELIKNRTLRKITISGFFAMPICIIKLLTIRSSGILQDLTIANWFRNPQKINENLYPSVTYQRRALGDLMNASPESLKIFTWDGILRVRANLFLREIRQPNIKLNEIRILRPKETRCVSQPWLQMSMEKPTRPGINAMINREIFDFLRSQAPTAQKVALRIDVGMQEKRLLVIFQSLNRAGVLKSLDLEIIGAAWTLNLEDFLECAKVEHLSLVDGTGYEHCRMHDPLENILMPQYLKSLHLQFARLDPRRVEGVRNPLLHNLTCLHFIASYQTRFTDECFRILLENMPKLRELFIEKAYYLTDVALTGFTMEELKYLKSCLKQEIINFDHLIAVQGNRPNIKKLAELEKLSLKGCKRLTDLTAAFAIGFPELKELKLSWCPKITDAGLQFIGRNNPKLKTIKLRNCSHVSQLGISDIVAHFPRITYIRTNKNKMVRGLIEGEQAQLHPYVKDVVDIRNKGHEDHSMKKKRSAE